MGGAADSGRQAGDLAVMAASLFTTSTYWETTDGGPQVESGSCGQEDVPVPSLELPLPSGASVHPFSGRVVVRPFICLLSFICNLQTLDFNNTLWELSAALQGE